MMHDDPIALVGGVRTAIGRFGGALKDVEAADLGAACIRELIARVGIDGGEVDEVVMGQVAQVGPDAYNARRCALGAGPPAVVDGDERQPPLLLGPAGDRERRAVDPVRPGAGRGRRRRRVDEPSAVPHLRRARRLAARVARGDRRHAVAADRSLRRVSDGRHGREGRRAAGRLRESSRMRSRCSASSEPRTRSSRATSTSRSSRSRLRARASRSPGTSTRARPRWSSWPASSPSSRRAAR